MSQQFTIQSESIRDKLNTLLPSQNLGAIGVELTGSTQIVPIVDLTEVAEGSNLRQDLQTALSHGSITAHTVSNTTTTIINTTGYFRIFGNFVINNGTSGVFAGSVILNDGTTDKTVLTVETRVGVATTNFENIPLDFNIFLSAGDSCKITTNSGCDFFGCSRQIADLSGNLTNPI
jgi:hypothetical protein